MKFLSMKNMLAITMISILLLIHISYIFVQADYENCLSDQNLFMSSNNEQLNIIVPDDYQTIQQAIHAAGPQHGYHIFVKNGIYLENLNIQKDGIILKGESKENTIIIGQNEENTIQLTGNFINISQFTIQHETNNHAGIALHESSGNNIKHNIIENNENGILLIRSHGNNIQHNIIMDNQKGCLLDFCLIGNTIKNNLFLKNNYGIYVNATCRSNTFYMNTFKENIHHAFSLTSNDNTIWNNDTKGNYWDDYTGIDANNDGIGDTPYFISPHENQDFLPLMEPVNDFLKPIITIRKPKENHLYFFDKKIIPFSCTLIIGTISIEVQTWENESTIDYVQLFINDELKTNTTTTPLVFIWDQPSWGKQTLETHAYDTAHHCTTKQLTIYKFG